MKAERPVTRTAMMSCRICRTQTALGICSMWSRYIFVILGKRNSKEGNDPNVSKINRYGSGRDKGTAKDYSA